MTDPNSPDSPYVPPAPASNPPPPMGGPNEADATGGVIPYKNPKALTAYYLGIFSLFPCVGFPLGVAAIVLGFMGLKARKLNPVIRGHVHAWIGIGCGFFGMLFHLPCALGALAALFEQQ